MPIKEGPSFSQCDCLKTLRSCQVETDYYAGPVGGAIVAHQVAPRFALSSALLSRKTRVGHVTLVCNRLDRPGCQLQ